MCSRNPQLLDPNSIPRTPHSKSGPNNQINLNEASFGELGFNKNTKKQNQKHQKRTPTPYLVRVWGLLKAYKQGSAGSEVGYAIRFEVPPQGATSDPATREELQFWGSQYLYVYLYIYIYIYIYIYRNRHIDIHMCYIYTCSTYTNSAHKLQKGLCIARLGLL